MHCTQSGAGKKIKRSRRNYHAFDSLRPMLKHCIILRAIHMLLFLGALEEVIQKTKRCLFLIEKFIKQLKNEGKLNCVVLGENIQKYMVTDEVGVPNDVIV